MWASILGGLISAGGQIAASAISAKQGREGQEALDKQHRANQQWYDTMYNSDYTQRSDVQAVLQRQRDILNEQYKRARATNAVAGGTDYSLDLQKQLANQSLANTMSSIASGAARYKDAIDLARNNEANAYAQGFNSAMQARAQRTAQAGTTIAKIGGDIIQSADDDWDFLFKNKRKGTLSNASSKLAGAGSTIANNGVVQQGV